MYKVLYLKPKEISNIESTWICLEKGNDMSYFQTYSWYSGILQLVLKDSWFYETKVAAVFKNETIVMIAPLFIIKYTWGLNKKGIYFWGRCGWSDYLNLIYADFDSNAYEYLVCDLKKKYHISTIHWEQLKETTSLYSYLMNEKNVISRKATTCVGLQMPITKEDYSHNLSKSSRQNLRTAVNRMKKDARYLKFVFDDRDVDLKLCEQMRAIRVVKKNKPQNVLSFIKQLIVKYTSIKFIYSLPFYFDKSSKMMVAYERDKPRAFFNYGINETDESIVLMAVGTDESFERYSPGMLLMYNFINHIIENKSIHYIDFTRGTERYKYALGGTEHTIYDVKIKI